MPGRHIFLHRGVILCRFVKFYEILILNLKMVIKLLSCFSNGYYRNKEKIVQNGDQIPAKHRLTVYASFPQYLEDTCCCRGDNPTRELSYALWF